MENQEYLIIVDATLGGKLHYCGKGRSNDWKEKLGSKIRKNKKYSITRVFAGNGPYGIPWFSISQIVTTPKDYTELSNPMLDPKRVKECAFELGEEEKGLLKKFVSEL